MWLTILSDQLPVSLGGPLPHQQADRTRAPLSATGPEGSPSSINPPCGEPSHSVLARLSASYPQLRGRLPTRYAPFRHSCPACIATLGAIVRLACLIHAASVRSEPESNSPKKNVETVSPCGPTAFLSVHQNYLAVAPTKVMRLANHTTSESKWSYTDYSVFKDHNANGPIPFHPRSEQKVKDARFAVIR